MRAPLWTRFLLTAAACVAVASGPGTTSAFAQQGRDRTPPGTAVRRPNPLPPPASAPVNRTIREAYERGYREGLDRGERDGRGGREFSYERDDWYRSADRGYNRTYGDRDAYRSEYRRGFAAGYRNGYERFRVVNTGRRNDRFERRVPRGYQEPAAARGYSDGFEKGLEDARDRDRYDPVRHNAYRKGDEGYFREYGSKDAYKTNYRAGFRQGYEDGYRNGGWR